MIEVVVSGIVIGIALVGALAIVRRRRLRQVNELSYLDVVRQIKAGK